MGYDDINFAYAPALSTYIHQSIMAFGNCRGPLLFCRLHWSHRNSLNAPYICTVYTQILHLLRQGALQVWALPELELARALMCTEG